MQDVPYNYMSMSKYDIIIGRRNVCNTNDVCGCFSMVKYGDKGMISDMSSTSSFTERQKEVLL